VTNVTCTHSGKGSILLIVNRCNQERFPAATPAGFFYLDRLT